MKHSRKELHKASKWVSCKVPKEGASQSMEARGLPSPYVRGFTKHPSKGLHEAFKHRICKAPLSQATNMMPEAFALVSVIVMSLPYMKTMPMVLLNAHLLHSYTGLHTYCHPLGMAWRVIYTWQEWFLCYIHKWLYRWHMHRDVLIDYYMLQSPSHNKEYNWKVLMAWLGNFIMLTNGNHMYTSDFVTCIHDRNIAFYINNNHILYYHLFAFSPIMLACSYLTILAYLFVKAVRDVILYPANTILEGKDIYQYFKSFLGMVMPCHSNLTADPCHQLAVI